jgi:nucleotidyltransferase/DNA polymerase involved in DNA repair
MIACIVLPYFCASIEQQYHPHLRAHPLVIRDTARVTQRVVAVNAQAAQAGVHQGMAVRYVQTVCPEAVIVPLNPPRYRQALRTRIEAMRTFSDRLEVADSGWNSISHVKDSGFASPVLDLNPAILFIDLGATKPKEHYSLALKLRECVEHSQLEPMIALATNRFTSYVAALSTPVRSVAVVPKGEEGWMLACHPITLLPLEADALRRLWLVGLRTLADFARLPAGSVLAQFGVSGKQARQLARGIDPTPIQVMPKVEELTRSFAFEGEVANQEVLRVGLLEVAQTLVSMLKETGKMARSLRLTLHQIDGGVVEQEIRLRRRSDDARHLCSTLQSLLERTRISCAVTELVVTAGDFAPVQTRQLELFPTEPSEDSRQEVLDDLIHRYGTRFYTASITNDRALLPEYQATFKAVGE